MGGNKNYRGRGYKGTVVAILLNICKSDAL